MPLFEMAGRVLIPVAEASFSQHFVKERDDLQKTLRDHIHLILPEHFVLAEEFGDWTDSKRRIDLLAIDKRANLVVIELKRGKKGAHMELQALRYASMVSQMTFAQAVAAHAASMEIEEGDAEQALLDFLEWDEPQETEFAQDVRIVLIAADFSHELVTSVLWLGERGGLNITCIRLRPHTFKGKLLLDVQTLVPLPEAADYQIRVKEKAVAERQEKQTSGRWTGFWFFNCGDRKNNKWSWEDSKKYRFLRAGGGERYTRMIRRLPEGAIVLVYLSGHGYVGIARVLEEAVPIADFKPPGEREHLADLALIKPVDLSDPVMRTEWCVAVEWIDVKDRDTAVVEQHLRPTSAKMKQPEVIDAILSGFDVDTAKIKEEAGQAITTKQPSTAS